MKARIRIGAGAGFSGDRIDPALELAEKGGVDYLVFECLAERTIALAHRERLSGRGPGYDPLLEERMRLVLPWLRRRGFRLITNMGAAAPRAAARRTAEIARALGLSGLRIAALTGDDVTARLMAEPAAHPLLEREGTLADLGEAVVSANAYLGSAGIVAALAAGAEVVITGRVADPALFLAPMIHDFGWPAGDWERLGQGTVIGHLLECAGQLTGGYFAAPPEKDVPGLARLGFPFADVAPDGSAELGKVEGSGGRISLATVKEQLLYEVLDPAAYLQPDVTADFTAVTLEELGPSRIAVRGGRGRPPPPTLKVSVGYRDGFIGEGEISYAGPGAVARAELAAAILRERFAWRGLPFEEVRFDQIGRDAVWRAPLPPDAPEPLEVRLRVAARAPSAALAAEVGREVEALYTNGPAGGGGVRQSVREVIAVVSVLIPRAWAEPRVEMEVA
jgi:hypothetical protein